MPSHTREDSQISARRKAVGLLAEAKVACKDILNSHDWAVAFANYIEAQPASDKLALVSLFTLPQQPPVSAPAIVGERRSAGSIGKSEPEEASRSAAS